MKALLLCWLGFAVAAGAAGPLSPAEELITFHLADPELEIELVAAEPQIDSPVALAWDAQGRLLVTEMSDYPRGPEKGRVRLLEDKDGDGRYEQSSVFAPNLPFPTCILPWKDGFFVTAAPDILYLKDTDGDGTADQREVIFTGFAEGNQQLRVNGLFYGLDNWIYGANGRSDGEVRRDGMEPVSLRNSDFRFDPRTFKFQAIAGRSQFGTTRDDWGNRFLSWNTIPIRHDVLPEQYLEGAPPWTGRASVGDMLPPGESNQVYPLTPAPLTFNNESTSHFNALAGLIIFRGHALGETYRGDAFIGESLRNLVHRRKLLSHGPTFQALRADNEQDREFLASSDAWFHPVNFATGPDGALYVVDFYRRFVEHPDFVPGQLRDTQPWREGVGHGRIWRVRNKNRRQERTPVFTRTASGGELVQALKHRNGWTRDTAQRLLLERKDRSVVPALEELVRQAELPETRLQALWTALSLEPAVQIIEETLEEERDPRVRQQALLLGAQHGQTQTAKLLSDPDIRVRFQAVLSVASKAPDQFREELIQTARRDAHDPWMRAALLSCLGREPDLTVSLLEADGEWRSGRAQGSLELLERLGEAWGYKGPSRPPFNSKPMSCNGGLAILAGMITGIERLGRPAADVNQILAIELLLDLGGRARGLLSEEGALLSQRLFAVRVCSALNEEGVGPTLLQLAGSTNGLEIAAARGLFHLGDLGFATALLKGWERFPTGVRQAIQQEAVSTAPGREILVSAVEQGSVPWSELERHLRDALNKQTDPELRDRVHALEKGGPVMARAEVLARFKNVTELKGDAGHGERMFAERCLTCHRREAQGHHVGPDLTGIRTRPAVALLMDILDPSRQVTPDYSSYTVEMKDGESWTGLLVSKSNEAITLRLAGGEERVLVLDRIESWQASQKSLMPDGMEEGWTAQDIADLLAFLSDF